MKLNDLLRTLWIPFHNPTPPPPAHMRLNNLLTLWPPFRTNSLSLKPGVRIKSTASRLVRSYVVRVGVRSTVEQS